MATRVSEVFSEVFMWSMTDSTSFHLLSRLPSICFSPACFLPGYPVLQSASSQKAGAGRALFVPSFLPSLSQ
jgi:hypothetical protein